jgi:hypothetical protein
LEASAATPTVFLAAVLFTVLVLLSAACRSLIAGLRTLGQRRRRSFQDMSWSLVPLALIIALLWAARS